MKQANIDRLKPLAAASPAWSQRMGAEEALSVDELELWYWRYANEIIYQAGQGSANYVLVIYEDLVHNPVGVMKRIYAASGLPWTQEIEAKIQKPVGSSEAIASAWKDKLSSQQNDWVESILGESPWPPIGRVFLGPRPADGGHYAQALKMRDRLLAGIATCSTRLRP